MLIIVVILCTLFVRQWRIEDARHNRPILWFEAYNASETIYVDAIRYQAYFFGPSKVEFLIDSKLMYQTEIFNDGGTLTEEHFSLLWSGDDKLDVVLKGREQHDEHIEFRFEDGQVWVNGLLVE